LKKIVNVLSVIFQKSFNGHPPIKLAKVEIGNKINIKINMKKITVSLCALFALFFAPSCFASLFIDKFNDNNFNGWVSVVGNWRVEDKMLKQDLAGDNRIALINNLTSSNQNVKVRALFHDYGGNGGIIIWYKDNNNYVGVLYYPAGGPEATIRVIERIDGVNTITNYPSSMRNGMWYKLRIKANSNSGKIMIYLDDIHLFTHKVLTKNRSGATGLFSGNNGGYFDNFRLSGKF